jgi:hypothetical protein
MLKFDSFNASYLDIFLQRYQKWCNHRALRTQPHQPLISRDSSGIPCFSYYEIDKINQCNSNLIAIDCLKEGLHELPCFNQYRRDRHYIIFSGCWWDPAQHAVSVPYTLIFSNFILYDVVGAYLNPDSEFFCQYKNYNFDYPKSLSFVGMHGHPRNHRVQFHDRLLEQITHKNFILKLDGTDYGQKSDHLDLIKKSHGRSLPNTFLEKFASFTQKHKAQYLSYASEIYNQSYFQVVLETDFEGQHQFFLTEKTIRVLMSGQPFVVAATTGFLTHLHTMGFRTYGQLWNEEYDSIINCQDRIKALIDLCIDLESFDWPGHQQELINIAEHNRSQFFCLSKHYDQEFVDFEKAITSFI